MTRNPRGKQRRNSAKSSQKGRFEEQERGTSLRPLGRQECDQLSVHPQLRGHAESQSDWGILHRSLEFTLLVVWRIQLPVVIHAGDGPALTPSFELLPL